MAEPDHLSMWTIYDHPDDYPDHFIAREWWVTAGRVEPSPVTVYRDEYLENVRTFVRTVAPDASRLVRNENDDPKIIESWV
jgi:hypothetical protein